MDDWIGDILEKADIIKIIGKYIELKQKGASDSFMGNCPFHHDKTPSFNVSMSKQVYHCFGCKESGNVISFVKKIENCGFYDSIKIICKEMGMQVPVSKFEKTQKVDYDKRDILFKLLKDAAVHYHHNLKKTSGKHALDYLYSRGFSDDLILKFGLGVSIGSSAVVKYLMDKGYKEQDMVSAGIIAQKDDNYYDVFNNRLIVPIINVLSEVVGFGARDLSGRKDVAKYRNSWNTQIFDKSNCIFGINNLKKLKQLKGSIPNIILVEGYMDVMALHQFGFEQCVASMGTALTVNQARQLKNFSNVIFVSFDGDTAGQMATLRSLDILTKVGLQVRVLSIPQNLDPDEFIKKYGSSEYQQLINEADTLPGFKIKSLLNGVNLSDTIQRTTFAINACKVVAGLSENSIEREEYRRLVGNLSGYSLDALSLQEQNQHQNVLQSVQTELDTSTVSLKKNNSIDFLMASILLDKVWVDYQNDIYQFLKDDLHKIIYQFAIERFKNPDKVYYPSILYSKIDQTQFEELTDLLNFGFLPGDDKTKFDAVLKNLKLEYLLEQKKQFINQFDTEQNISILKKIKEIDDEIRQTKAETQ
ncbi:MAG: DNA primase [Clostridiales bacterium]|nr:DNA primase [Clostridiales bacterium]